MEPDMTRGFDSGIDAVDRRRLGRGRRVAIAALLAAGALVANACASPGTPSWLSGRDDTHPESDYMSAVGTGRSAETAHSNAFGQLSRVFHARVDQVVTDDQTVHTRSDTRGRRTTADRERVDVETRIETSGSFEGVEIAHTWQDGETGLWYALAVLDRDTEGRHLVYKMAAKSELIASSYARGLRAPTSLERARWFGAALHESIARDELVLRYSIVSGRPAPRGDVAPPTPRLRDEVAEEISNTSFAVHAVDGGSSVRQMIAETLTDLGFTIVNDPDPAADDVAVIRGELALHRLDRVGKEWHFYGWQGSFEVSVDAGSRVLLVSNFDGNTAHLDDRRARERARGLAREALEDELASRLGDFLIGADPEREVAERSHH